MDPVRKQGVARFPGFPLRVPRERQGEGDGGSPGPVQTGESRVKARYANSKRICVHYGRRRVKSSHFPSRPLSRGPLPPPIRPPPPTLPDVEGRHPRSNLRRSFRRARVPSSLLIYGGACRTGFRNSDVVESARSRYASCVTRPNANGKCGTSSFPIAGWTAREEALPSLRIRGLPSRATSGGWCLARSGGGVGGWVGTLCAFSSRVQLTFPAEVRISCTSSGNGSLL